MGGFKLLLSIIDRSSRRKVRKHVAGLNNSEQASEMQLRRTQSRIVNPLSSLAHMEYFMKIDHAQAT